MCFITCGHHACGMVRNMNDRLDKQVNFLRELDKEKFIGRQTYLTDGVRKENDAEHAWHMAVAAILLSEYSNEKIDLAKTLSMILLHDVVEIDAGDTYAYDTEAKKTEAEREERAARRIYGMLPADQADKFYSLWREFEERKTPEAKFARTLDNFQPLMLQDATKGKAWEEHGVESDKVYGRNSRSAEGSAALWDYANHNFIKPWIEAGKLKGEFREC